MAKTMLTAEDVSEWMVKISDAPLQACQSSGLIVSAVGQIHMEGDFIRQKNGQIVVALNADANIPTEPVDAGGKVSWNRKKFGFGRNRVIVDYKITVRTPDASPVEIGRSDVSTEGENRDGD